MNVVHSNGSAGGGNIAGDRSYAWENTGSEWYSESTNSWTNWVTYPGSNSGGNGSFVLGGNGFVFNGPANQIYMTDTVNNTWINKSPSLPLARFRVLQSASHALNGYGWWYGGDLNNSTTLLNSIDQYNQWTNVWTTRASSNANTPRYSGGFTHNGHVYQFGGNDTVGYGNQTDRYNDAANTWTLRANYPISIANTFATTRSGYPIAIGG
jgi:hypothetical protein